MRIVIAGDDEIAFRLAEQLMADHAVTLICSEQMGTRIERLDVEAVFGPVSSTGTHHRAHVQTAEVFVACSPIE